MVNSTDLTTSSINLATALLNLPLARKAADEAQKLHDWLVRERIDASTFDICCELAKSLAHPNEKGLGLQRSISSADHNILNHVFQVPINLVVPGSLGRFIGKDPELCYMSTTVACLTHFRDPDFASDTLCSMILDQGGHSEKPSNQYRLQRLPLKSVISRIVQSIYKNVINVGHVLPLPSELQHLHQHLLDDIVFAGIVMGVHRTGDDVVIRSDMFLADLTVWFYYHFEGNLVVTVEKRVLLDVTLGSIQRKIHFMINYSCPAGSTECLKATQNVEASLSTGKTAFTILKGQSIDHQARSYTRRAFYVLDDLFPKAPLSSTGVLSKSEILDLTLAAKHIVQGILALRLGSQGVFEKFVSWKISFDATSLRPDLFTFQEALKRHPSILHLDVGSREPAGPFFRRPQDTRDEENSTLLKVGDEDSLSNISRLLSWFPFADDIIEKLRIRCSCSRCHVVQKNVPHFRWGCLRATAVTRLFMLIAHAICDGFGCSDVSGSSDPEDQVKAVVVFLDDLLEKQSMSWDVLFHLVTCTVVGTPWDEIDYRDDDSGYGSAGASSMAAVQSGSIVIVASWLDLNRIPTAMGLFGVTVAEGNVQGICDDFGIVRCEADSGGSKDNTTSDPVIQDEGSSESHDGTAIPVDESSIDVSNAIFPTADFQYRLMTTIRSGSYIRIVDPSRVMPSLFICRRVRCNHEKTRANPSVPQMRILDLCNILTEWVTPFGLREGIEISTVLNSNIKVNTTLAFNWFGCIMRNVDQSCISCATDVFRGAQIYPKRIVNYQNLSRKRIKH